ncbi:hypothetical protein [Chitinophaga alhagiae]|uniref:hypothetical protein n=1 Tax=Chitinophaga alhagiae TaxID=2203219 RepID=UPI000E5C54AD|nr:hypothetical protein [Chitinophaga alhagiae]
MWLEGAFLWLVEEFGEENIRRRRVFRPDVADFPQAFDQTENDAHTLLPVIAQQMETDPANITLRFYSQERVDYSGGHGGIIPSNYEKQHDLSLGMYHGRNRQGSFIISLELGALKHTEGLVATLAHEIAHIKLLGDGRMKKVDEDMTDLLTVIYGFGIFNANTAYRFVQGFEGWSTSGAGYLKQQEWGYALALFCFIRKEIQLPEWIQFLTPNVKGDVKKAWDFIQAHPEKIFRKS